MKRVNNERARKRRLEHHGTERRTQWWREQPCVCQGKHPACTRGWSEPSHVVSRGAGGTSADIVPMSRGCHRAWHDHGRDTYCETIGLDRMRIEFRAAYYATIGDDAPHPPGDPTT